LRPHPFLLSEALIGSLFVLLSRVVIFLLSPGLRQLLARCARRPRCPARLVVVSPSGSSFDSLPWPLRGLRRGVSAVRRAASLSPAAGPSRFVFLAVVCSVPRCVLRRAF
jgi:hypothetical protein